MNASNFKIGNCICLKMDIPTSNPRTFTKEYRKIIAIDYDRNIITVADNNNHLDLDCNLCGNIIEPIPVNESTLTSIGYAKIQKEHLYGLVGITVYEKELSLEDGTYIVIDITKKEGYVCIMEKPTKDALMGCEYIGVPFIHNLQNLIADRYKRLYPIEPKLFIPKKEDETNE